MSTTIHEGDPFDIFEDSGEWLGCFLCYEIKDTMFYTGCCSKRLCENCSYKLKRTSEGGNLCFWPECSEEFCVVLPFRSDERNKRSDTWTLTTKDINSVVHKIENLLDTDTIGDLMLCIQSITGIPQGQQRIIFEGRQLSYDATLEECDLDSYSQVHLYLALRGS